MNLDEITGRSPSPIASHVAARGDRHDPAGSSDPEHSRAPSVASDSEWVSPFTVLPPFPSLRKNRPLRRSPEERRHQRNTSSAYYAAAWGSPYATPSPSRSPPLGSDHPTREFQIGSPLSSKHTRFQSIAVPSEHSSRVDRRLEPDGPPSRPRSSSWDRLKTLSERFNWLSDTENSGSDGDGKAGKTPTRKTYLQGLHARAVHPTKTPAARTHHARESVATITPDTFHEQTAAAVDEVATAIMEPAESDVVDTRPGSNPVDKPLPRLPSATKDDAGDVVVNDAGHVDIPMRPAIPTAQSFQRPKKKVPWKGKTCVIALPLTDREAAGLPPLLTAQEVQDRLQKWADLGFDLDGFQLGESQDASSPVSSQSRALYPDPADVVAERKTGQLQVHIPDQSEWDAWVEYLKEEKLRALGVTPSNSEAPQSTQSPFSSSVSRVSSAFPSIAPSPPISTISNHGHQIRLGSNTFSPPLSHPSQAGSHVASPLAGLHGSMHGYKGSIAFNRMTSPFDYPVSQPNAFNQSARQTPSVSGMRQFSPPNASQVPSLGQMLSPMIPAVPTVPSNDNDRGATHPISMEHIRQQQQRQQQIHAQVLQHQHQRQQSFFPQPPKSAELPRTPTILESPSRSTPEIVHPTPRSHRHNLSAALQKGVDDAEAARGTQNSTALSQKLQSVQNATTDRVAEGVDEDGDEPDHDELPVLQRPETLGDQDDASEIETNPSIAASPLLMDDKNPFANVATMRDALTERETSHKPTNSLSKFNVQAPEFSPSKPPSTAGFSFNPITAQSFVPSHSANPSLSRLTHSAQAPSISKFNVEAPTFTPSFMKPTSPQDSIASTPVKALTSAKQTPAEKSVFTFSSPFNVEAPEFKPAAQPFSFNASAFHPAQSLDFSPAGATSVFEPHHASSGSIFGNVTIDPSSRVSRRGTKALPILPPRSRESTPVDDGDVDEEGRLSAPSDRQKRARRVDDDGEQAPQFADSAPFDHAEGLTIKQEADYSTGSQPVSNQIEGEIAQQFVGNQDEKATVVSAPPTPVDDKFAPESEVTEPSEAAVHSSEDNGNVTPLKDDTVQIEVAHSPSADDLDDDVVVVEEELSSDSRQETGTSGEDGIPPGKFSTLASGKNFVPIQPALPEPKKIGLGASRFAASPPPKFAAGLRASRFAASPPSSPPPKALPEALSRHTAPPEEMYEYVNPGDIELSQPGSTRSHSGGEFTPNLPKMPFETTPELVKSIEDSMRLDQVAQHSRSNSDGSRVDGTMPSYEEIDAVMKQFEDNPDLGIERDATPIKSTPLIDMRLPPNLRSDAPSPSPRRLQEGFRRSSPQRRADYGLGIHKLNDSNGAISDWGNDYSPHQEHKLHQRAGFFDGHVNSVVDSIIEHRLEPLERTLQTIQSSLALLAPRPGRHSRRSMSTDNRESDADDEDDFDNIEGRSQSYHSRSPGRRDRKADRIRNAVIDAMSAYQPPLEQPTFNMAEIQSALEEMRQLSRQVQQPLAQPDIKSMIEEAMASHQRSKAATVDDDAMAQQEAFVLKIQVLEKSFKDAEERADKETQMRQQAEADMQALNKKLLDVQDVATRLREADEAAQHNHAALLKEQELSRAREAKLIEAEEKSARSEEKNVKLETLATEYRRSVEELRNQVAEEKSRYQDLEFTLHVIKTKHAEREESRQALRGQIDRLQVRMAQVVDDMSQEEAEWRNREHELIVLNQKTQTALDHEIRHRQKIETHRDELERERKEIDRLRTTNDHSQLEITRLQSEVGQLRQESKIQQDNYFQLERELAHAKSVNDTEVTKATAQLQSEADAARWTVDNLKSDFEAQVKRLQSRLDNAELDLEDQKAKHDSTITEITESHNQAIHESGEKRESALQEQRAAHDKKLNDLRERHTRALHNASDDKHRLEYHLNEKLTLSQDKVKHLEGKVSDLEDRLEVTKSAARAAVEAATAKGINLPTPAPSVVASPPQRAASTSVPPVKGSELPERISPQALRESIMVLQDQLQNREMRIEELQQELAAIDKDAPAKIKERENEIAMLRELLSVRADDLAELISILSKSDFNRERARDAAIRLRANTQMEQQLKERAHAIGQMSMPSISSITNLASSPRSLPMAAAAAWGNWRKARDFSTSALNNLTGNAGEQTPSKSNNGSPSSILAGIMTPPSTTQRSSPSADGNSRSPPSMRPLNTTRKSSAPLGPARPLRGYSSQPRSLSSRQTDQRRGSADSQSKDSHHSEDPGTADSPRTPTFSRGIGSSVKGLDFSDDVDDDASPFDGAIHEETRSMTSESDRSKPSTESNAVEA